MSENSSNKVLFKKKSSRSFVRKRRPVDESSSSEDDTKVVRSKKEWNFLNPLVQRSDQHGKRKQVDIQSSGSEEDQVTVSFKSKRTAQREGPSDMGATSVLETETEKDRDAQAVYERGLETNKLTRGQADDKIYRGLQNYSHFFEKKDTIQGNAASGGVRKGPIRAPDHIRSTVRWDYQPDLCKDFKETGFCGFGDSCKFLHDRTDYKYGWQLELDAQKTSNKFNDSDDENYEIPSDEEHIPFKCLFCRQSFVDPVVTKCRHFFCEKCALGHFKKSVRCYVCNERTNGMFVPATEITSRLSKVKEADSDD